MRKEFVSPSGRIFYRHWSDNGTVMKWSHHGIQKETLILDAKYRSYGLWSDNCIETPDLLRSQNGYGYIASTYQNQYTDPIESEQIKRYFKSSDEYLDSRMFFHDPNSSTHNSDRIINNYKLSAAKICSEVDAVLPSLELLVRIYCEGPILDKLDPTVREFPDQIFTVKGGGWFSRQTPSFAWSSSEHDYYYPWCVLNSGLVGCVGKTDLPGGIIPVREIY